MSDREIVDDLKQQKMEKVVMQELQDSPVTIKKSGLFADIDKRFGEPIDDMAVSGGTEGGMPPQGDDPMGGGAPMGDDPMGGGDMPPLGGGDAPMGGGGAPDMNSPMMEGMSEEAYENHVNKLVFGTTKEEGTKKIMKQKEIIHENNTANDNLNNKANDMVNEIDEILKTKNINILKEIDENNESNSIDINNLDLSSGNTK